MIGLHRCDEGYNTAEDPFGKINVSNKIEDAKLKIFNLITRINEKSNKD